MKERWLWWTKADLKTELRQLVDEGREIDNVRAAFDRLLGPEVSEENPSFQDAANALLDETAVLPMRSEYAYVEPSDLEGIHAERPAGRRELSIEMPASSRRDHILAAWLGRCAGCLLGKPIEGIQAPKLWALLERAGLDEIPDYLWRLPGLDDEDYEALDFASLLAWKQTDHMPEDDDTNFTIAAMAVVKSEGLDFAPADVADFWLHHLPILHTFTAERVAYRNLVNNV